MTIDLDEDVSEGVAEVLRRLGYVVITAREAGNKHLSDPKQLAFAARHGHVFVTCNWKHFDLLHEAWATCAQRWQYSGDLHSGILVVPNGNQATPEQVAALIDQFVQRGDSPVGRLFRRQRPTGWQEIAVAP